jgi:hypothetical protein
LNADEVVESSEDVEVEDVEVEDVEVEDVEVEDVEVEDVEVEDEPVEDLKLTEEKPTAAASVSVSTSADGDPPATKNTDKYTGPARRSGRGFQPHRSSGFNALGAGFASIIPAPIGLGTLDDSTFTMIPLHSASEGFGFGGVGMFAPVRAAGIHEFKTCCSHILCSKFK